MNLILRWLAVTVAVGLAVWLVPGVEMGARNLQEQAFTLLGVSLIIGLLNAILRPIVKAMSFCLLVLTLGLFMLVINTAMLLLTSWIAGQLGLGFHVDSFAAAFWGSLVISIASAIISGILTDD